MDRKLKQFEELDLRVVADLEHKKFFEIEDLNRFKDINFFIIKGKKNIGKTFSMISKMKEIAENNKKFVLLRISEGEAKTISREWNADTNIPFKIKANRIYYENKDCGQVAWVKNLQQQRSQQFNNYQAIFFDEFVAFSEKNYGGGAESEFLIVRNFIRFLIDVQRNKKDLKVFCFGNNDITVDIFTKYFRLPINKPLLKNKFAGILFWNLENFYQGADKTLGHKLAIFDYNLENYLQKNLSLENIEKLENYEKIDNSFVRLILILHKNFYKFSEFIYFDNENKASFLSSFSISNIEDLRKYSKIPKLALTLKDNLDNKDSIFWENEYLKLWLSSIFNLIKYEKLKFSDLKTKEIFENFIAIML